MWLILYVVMSALQANRSMKVSVMVLISTVGVYMCFPINQSGQTIYPRVYGCMYDLHRAYNVSGRRFYTRCLRHYNISL